MKKITIIKKLRKKELESAASHSKGFSFKVGSNDPRESLLSETRKATSISKIIKEIRKAKLSASQTTQQLAELTLENQLLKLEVSNLTRSNKRLSKNINAFILVEKEAAKAGGISKSEILNHNKTIAEREYLRISKVQKVSAKKLYNHLVSEFPTQANDHELDKKRPESEYDHKLKPWRFGTIRDFHRKLVAKYVES